MKKFQDISNAYDSLSNKDNNFKNHTSKSRNTGQEWAQQYKYYPKSQQKYTNSSHEFYKTGSRKTSGANQEEFSPQNENKHQKYIRQRFVLLLLCSIFYLCFDSVLF